MDASTESKLIYFKALGRVRGSKLIQLKNILSYLLTASVLFACKTQDEPEQQLNIVEEYSFPKFVEIEKFIEDTVKITWMYDGNHNPLYFGFLQDTIEVKRVYGKLIPPPLAPGSTESIPEIKKGKYDDYFLDWMDIRDYVNYDSIELNIMVDTSQFISNRGRKAYPVLIKNLHTDTIYIGYGSYIPIITQALNKKGEWKPIEERFIYMCGNGVKSIIQPPKQIVVTSEIVYAGDFKTKLRIKLGMNYSREFIGSINLTQFESEWNSIGN